MTYVIRIIGLANGDKHHNSGHYVRSYDPTYVRPEGYDGGLLVCTPFISWALVFPSMEAATELWKTTAPEPYHLRPDGKPNRPLTAFTVEIVPVQPKETCNDGIRRTTDARTATRRRDRKLQGPSRD